MKCQEYARIIERWVKYLTTRRKVIKLSSQLTKTIVLEVWIQKVYDYGKFTCEMFIKGN